MNSQKKTHMYVGKCVRLKSKNSHKRFVRKKARQCRKEFAETEKELDKLEGKINNGDNSPDVCKKYTETKSKLDDYYKQRCKGASIRARVKWFEEGERNTKYFLNLEKSQGVRKQLTKVRNKNNQVVTNGEDVLKETVQFYERLYKSQDISNADICTYMNNVEAPKLNGDDSACCEGLLTVDECKRAVFKMKKNKTPGSDGLPIEWYQTFWNDISYLMVNSLNFSYTNGQLSCSQRKGIITLLYKKGDHEDLQNWRPINLLNYDYKILAYVLASRLQKVIGKIIEDDQTGYIKGRFVGQNIRLIEDIIELIGEADFVDPSIIFVDFHKAFDTLEFNFIHNCLKKFGLGESFINWVTIMYTNVCSSVLVNGWVSEEFNVSRGIRQGCPLSALLFILAVEFLGISIRQNEQVEGIDVNIESGTKSIKICQLADDTTIFVKNTKSAKEAIKVIENFGKVAGTKLNKSKTEVLWLGKNPPPENFLDNIPWTYGPIKSLGIYFSKNTIVSNKLNWDDKLEKLKRILDNWRKRNLTLFGKVTVIKSLALSQIMYTAAVIYTPDWVVKQIRMLCLNFLWNNKNHKIKDIYLQRDYINGGIRLTDIKTQIMSLKLRWIGRILEGKNSSWKCIPISQFNRIGGLSLALNYNLNPEHVKTINRMSPFYQEIFTAWCILQNKTETQNISKNYILNQVIWNNSRITHAKKPLFLKEWVKSGILTIRDILDESGFIASSVIERKLTSRVARASCFFNLEKIKRCIQKSWRDAISNVNLEQYDNIKRNIQNPPVIVIKGKSHHIWEITTKAFYETLMEENTLQSRAEIYWQNKINDNQVGQKWKDIWKFKLKDTKDTRLKNFNLKLLYNIVPVNGNLYKWKLSSNEECTICNVKEDISHAFLLCEKIKSFWSWLENIICVLKEKYKTFKMNNHNLIFGCNIQNKHFRLLNFILSCALFVIYKCIVIRNFENKQYNNNKVKSMFIQELKNQICIDVKAHRGQKFFSRGDIDLLKYYFI